LLALVIFLYSFRLWQTTGCLHFAGFYFNPLSIKIDVEQELSLDQPERRMGRVFHNKVIAAPFAISKSYAKVLDPKFLLDLMGLAGVLLLVLAITRIVETRNKKGFFHITLQAILIFISLTHISPKTAFWLMSLGFYSLSLWGIRSVSKNKLIPFLFIILILLSLWYFAFNWQMRSICDEIFFN